MIIKVWQSISRFWATDHGLSIFLVMIVVVAFVLPPLASLGILGRLIIDIFFSMLLISGIAAMSLRRSIFVTLVGISIVALVVRWIDSFNTSPLLDVMNHLATITIIILFSIAALTQVMKRGPTTVHRIEGAIAVYLLLGLAWGQAYGLIEYLNPGAFTGAATNLGRFSSWTYFSFVTLATLGYGDIVPVHPVARSLAVAEAITGPLYLAILIARLVSKELYYQTGKEEDAMREFPRDETPGRS
jgi:hypothetical protein